MKQLETLIGAMRAKRTVGMTVVNLEDGRPVYTNATNAKLTADYGGIEEFLETIYRNGITSVRIFERRSNGTNFIPFGQPFDLDMVSRDETPSVFGPAAKAAQPETSAPIAAVPIPAPAPLNGPGLNAVQVYHAQDYPRLLGEHSAMKIDNKRLEDQILALKEEILELKFSEKKELGKQEMMGTMVGHAQGILNGLASIGFQLPRKPGDAGALAGPPAYTAAQTEVFENLKRLDDQTLYTFDEIAGNLHNQEFAAELMEVLKKHNIIPTE